MLSGVVCSCKVLSTDPMSYFKIVRISRPDRSMQYLAENIGWTALEDSSRGCITGE